MVKYPSIQKTVRKFILNENGSITKANLIKISVIVAGSICFIAHETANAIVGQCHANQPITVVDGHNNADQNLHSQCAANHDSAHASHSSHCSGGWGCSHSSSIPLVPGTAYDCKVHSNTLVLSPTTDWNGKVDGTHNHATSHQSSIANTAYLCSSNPDGVNAAIDGSPQCSCHSSHSSHSNSHSSHSSSHYSG